MGKLNLLHHKSYHPYKAENIERVKRDEAKARGEEEEKDRRMVLADSEARLDRMRKKSSKIKDRDGQDEGEKALDRQLKGIKDVEEEEPHSGTMIVRPDKGKEREEGPQATVQMEGKHINFWSEFEAGTKTTLVNPEAALEKAMEKEKVDSLTKMFLAKKGDDIRGWYATEDMKTEKERKEGVDRGLERAYKDNEHKKLSDPLALMNSYLKRRSDVINNVPKPRSSSSSSVSVWERYPTGTPETQRGDLSPIITSLLAPRRRKGDPIPPPSPPRSAPPVRPQSSSSMDPKAEASSRVSSERARTAALLASRKKGVERGYTETPKSEYGSKGYGMFNREETREAKLGWGERKERRNEKERGGYGGGYHGGDRGSSSDGRKRGW